MLGQAKLSMIRIAPRKVGLIADELRGKKINDALTYLSFSPRKRTATVLSRLIKSAASNAIQKSSVDVDRLIISTLLVGPGPILKRFRPRAKGSASRINKRTSNITVVVTETSAKKKRK